MDNTKTAEEFAAAKSECRELFSKKLIDYGTSWRIMRPMSLTDQIMIKAMRIRSIEDKGWLSSTRAYVRNSSRL